MKHKNVNIKFVIAIIIGMLIIIIVVSSRIQSAKYIDNNSNAIHGADRNYTTYANTAFNFSVDYPNNWTMVPMESKIMFLSPTRYEGGYITLTIQLLYSINNGGTYSLADDVITDLMYRYREQIGNISNVSINYKREELLAGYKGKEICISFTANGMNHTQTQIIARGGNLFYVIAYQTQLEHYNEYVDVYEHAKKSFKISA